MKYAYFSPCTTSALSKELDTSTKAIAKKLGIELVPLPFSCCGRSITADASDEFTLFNNLRNVTLAEKENLPLLTTSATCYQELKRAQWTAQVDPEFLKRANSKLQEIELKYQGKGKIVHLLEALYDERHEIESLSPGKMTSLRVVPYYGEQITKPRAYMDKEQHLFEELIESCGAKVADIKAKHTSCGWQTVDYNEEASFALAAEIFSQAEEQNADVIVTLCPFVQVMLDLHQKRIASSAKKKWTIPILHVSQLVGLAIGVPQEDLGLERHFTSTTPLADKVRM